MSRLRPRSRPDRAIGMKIAAEATKAIPAEAKAMYEPSAIVQRDDANSSATTVGIVDWKTIAPVMLPIARVSLPCRTQMIELNFSGSSVAIGAMTSARSASSTPERRRQVLDRADEEARRRAMIRPRAASTWRLTTRRRGSGRVEPRRAADRAAGSAAARDPRRRPSGRPRSGPCTYQA